MTEDLTDHPTQHADDKSYGANTGMCWRCDRFPPMPGSPSGVCRRCRPILLGDEPEGSDDDPKKVPPPAFIPFRLSANMPMPPEWWSDPSLWGEWTERMIADDG